MYRLFFIIFSLLRANHNRNNKNSGTKTRGYDQNRDVNRKECIFKNTIENGVIKLFSTIVSRNNNRRVARKTSHFTSRFYD